MRVYRRLLVPVVLLVVAACSSGPPPEPPAPVFDPAGDWAFMVDVEGQVLEGLLRISGSDEQGWRGSLSSAMGEAAMSRVRVEGATIRFSLPDFDGAAGRIDFEGDEFSGEISTEMGAVPISGTRR